MAGPAPDGSQSSGSGWSQFVHVLATRGPRVKAVALTAQAQVRRQIQRTQGKPGASR